MGYNPGSSLGCIEYHKDFKDFKVYELKEKKLLWFVWIVLVIHEPVETKFPNTYQKEQLLKFQNILRR